jgi:hypothetical protein
MKVQFQHEDIRKFLLKKFDELQGENILLQLQKPEEPQKVVSVSEALNSMYNVGKSHGSIEGQMKFLNELLDFFQIEK